MAARPSDEPDTATHGRPEDVLYRQGPPAAAVIDGTGPNGAGNPGLLGSLVHVEHPADAGASLRCGQPPAEPVRSPPPALR